MIGYAGFNDEGAWPIALAMSLDSILLVGAGISLLVWLFGLRRDRPRVRALAILLLGSGLLALGTWPFVLGQYPAAEQRDAAFTCLIVGIHASSAVSVLANGWLALRELRGLSGRKE